MLRYALKRLLLVVPTLLEAINRRDYPVIQAVNLFVALLVALSNLLVDLS